MRTPNPRFNIIASTISITGSKVIKQVKIQEKETITRENNE